MLQPTQGACQRPYLMTVRTFIASTVQCSSQSTFVGDRESGVNDATGSYPAKSRRTKKAAPKTAPMDQRCCTRTGTSRSRSDAANRRQCRIFRRAGMTWAAKDSRWATCRSDEKNAYVHQLAKTVDNIGGRTTHPVSEFLIASRRIRILSRRDARPVKSSDSSLSAFVLSLAVARGPRPGRFTSGPLHSHARVSARATE
jgi:hypothetical protein